MASAEAATVADASAGDSLPAFQETFAWVGFIKAHAVLAAGRMGPPRSALVP